MAEKVVRSESFTTNAWVKACQIRQKLRPLDWTQVNKTDRQTDRQA